MPQISRPKEDEPAYKALTNCRQHELKSLALRAMKTGELTLQLDAADSLLEFGKEQRIGPIVAHALIEGPNGQHQEANKAHQRSAHRMQVLLGQLDLVAAALASRKIPLIALKNAGIARGLFACPACCPMGDIDVLVPRRDFEAAHHIVTTLEYKLDTRAEIEKASIEAGLHSGGLEYSKTVDGVEVWLELQWRAVAGRWIRPDQEPKTDDLIARSVPIEGSAARLLSPVDNLIQVCLHTAKHSFVRAPGLRLHTDVDRIVAFSSIDWELFVSGVRALGVKTPVFFSLSLAQMLLETPIPREVLDDLAPPRWKQKIVLRWIKRADVFNPDEKKFSRLGMLVFHALLYEDLRGLIASATDSSPQDVRIARFPMLAVRGASRLRDLVFRYQA